MINFQCELFLLTFFPFFHGLCFLYETQYLKACGDEPPLGRPRRRWEDNIKMDLREIGFGAVDWIHLAQDRDRWRDLVNTVMNLRVP
jgi:hypothetical protein